MKVKKTVILLTPLLLTPYLFHSVSDGGINFGGGEKDIFLVLIFGFWAVLFLLAGIFNWDKYVSDLTWAVIIFSYSVGTLLTMFLVLLLYSLAST